MSTWRDYDSLVVTLLLLSRGWPGGEARFHCGYAEIFGPCVFRPDL